MSPQRWDQLVSDLKSKFTVLEDTVEDLEPGPGSSHTVVVESPMGQIKLVFTRRPVVLDKKTHGSHRIGASVNVEYVYSEDEESTHLETFKYNDMSGEWEELRADRLFPTD